MIAYLFILLRTWRLRRDVKRMNRAYLEHAGRRTTVLASAPIAVLGATIDWSPVRQVATVSDFVAEAERTELEVAAAELKPMIDATRAKLAAAFRHFDAAMLAPMSTTAHWHAAAAAAQCCQECAGRHARTFGAIGERFGIRSFRLDTDTAEYKIYAAA